MLLFDDFDQILGNTIGQDNWIFSITHAQVFKVQFWMALHGGHSPKRTIVWSVMGEVVHLDLGVLTKEQREKTCTLKTTSKYIDANGQSRFMGTSDLSQTQNLG